jgi:[ribosomal protein S5]-alanine N-acetyltransferase
MTVTLRPMIAADLPAKVRWANDPRVNEWIAMPERVDLEGTQRWFERSQRDPRVLLFTLMLDERAIGFAKLERDEHELAGQYCGLAIGEPEVWGRGLGKAAVRQLLAVAFEREGWARFWGHWPAWNRRSIELHRGLGFAAVGVARARRRYLDGSEHEVLILEHTRARWLAARPC